MDDETFLSRLDDEHRAVLDAFPGDLFDLSDIPAARAKLHDLFADAIAAVPEIPGITVTDHHAPGPVDEPGAPDVMVRVYRPDDLPAGAPALYWIHGGGMVMGDVSTGDVSCKRLALDVGCVVASVEYRLAPEHPHPAPIEDCYAGLVWMHDHADELGIDVARIAIGGGSAGGGLAASLALLARDRGGPAIAHQLLIYPMLDDRNETPSSHAITFAKVWNRAANVAAWAALLGDSAGTPDVSPYAAAARADDLTGLPPAYVVVGDLDLFLDEDIDYATRLLRAGVPTELHVYPGAFHGSDGFAPGTALSRRWNDDRNAALHRALHG